MKYPIIQQALVASALLISSTVSLQLAINDGESVRNAAATVAYGLMSYYTNNQSTTPPADVGEFVAPAGSDMIYWWNSGAIWGGMVDYTIYTGDTSYLEATKNALAANVGEKGDLIIDSKRGQEGTDDQAFWALSMMSAAEANFPAVDGKPAWVDVAEGAFKSITSRWDTANCNGGFFWQIYADNYHGLKYKNSVANGGLFQLAARLALLKKDNSFSDWAEKVWDWSAGVGFISDKFEVFDGAGIEDGANCTRIDRNRWTYNHGLFTYGAAAMYAHTGDQKWLDRTKGLVKSTNYFFNAHSDAPNVLSEIVCEHAKSCNMDQQSFKAYLARWLGKTAALLPKTAATINPWLQASAQAAAGSCSGKDNACGTKWYTGGFDGLPGINQQLCAMEVIQSLMHSAGNKGDGNDNADVLPSEVKSSDAPVSTTFSTASPLPTSERPSPTTSSSGVISSVADQPTPSPTSIALEPSTIVSSAAETSLIAPTAVESISIPPPTPTPDMPAYSEVPAPPASSEASESCCEAPVVVTVTETEAVSTTVLPTTDVLPSSVCEAPVIVTVTFTTSPPVAPPVVPSTVVESTVVAPTIVVESTVVAPTTVVESTVIAPTTVVESTVVAPTTVVDSSLSSPPLIPSNPPVPTSIVTPVSVTPTSFFVMPTGTPTPSPLPAEGAASKSAAAGVVLAVGAAVIMLL